MAIKRKGTFRYLIRRIGIFLKRFNHSKGFGIQSPSAFLFSNHIINDHHHYDVYNILRRKFPHESRLTLKLSRLYFRIAQAQHSAKWTICTRKFTVYQSYIQAGSPRTKIEKVLSNNTLFNTRNGEVLLMCIDSNWYQLFDSFVSSANANSLLIVEAIHVNNYTKAIWQQMISDSRTVVSFDLYYCGIICFDNTKSKQQFVINF